MLVDSPARRAAAKRWTSDDAVLAALAAAIGINGERTDSPGIADDAVVTVLAAVNAAVWNWGSCGNGGRLKKRPSTTCNEASPLTVESEAGQARWVRAVCGDGRHGDGQ